MFSVIFVTCTLSDRRFSCLCNALSKVWKTRLFLFGLFLAWCFQRCFKLVVLYFVVLLPPHEQLALQIVAGLVAVACVNFFRSNTNRKTLKCNQTDLPYRLPPCYAWLWCIIYSIQKIRKYYIFLSLSMWNSYLNLNHRFSVGFL